MISENAIIRDADYSVVTPELLKTISAAIILLIGVVAMTSIFRSESRYSGIIGVIAMLLILGGGILLLNVTGAI